MLKASWCFSIALALNVGMWSPGFGADMPGWSRQVTESAYRLVATPEEMKYLLAIPFDDWPRFLETFWKRRDPTPFTPENEYREQFEERVEVATRRFATVPFPDPWDTRGEVYIRFGPPDHTESGPDSVRSDIEYWYYYGNNLKLQFNERGLDYELVPFVDPFTTDVESYGQFVHHQDQVATTSARYRPPDGVVERPLAVDCYPFRRSDGSYDLYVACALPLRSIATNRDRRGGDVRYTARLRLVDSTLRERWRDSAVVDVHFARFPKGMLAQNQWETVVPPGFYTVITEVADPTGKRRAVQSVDRWCVPHDDSSALQLSPLVIAADVRSATPEATTFVRNGKEIIPMPGRVFENDQDVAFYHEVYNLEPDTSGHCSYRLEYAVYDDRGGGRRVLARRVVSSPNTETFQAGRIPHSALDKGSYILEAKTRDLIAGVTRVALAQLKVE